MVQSSVTESSWVGYDTWYKMGLWVFSQLCNLSTIIWYFPWSFLLPALSFSHRNYQCCLSDSTMPGVSASGNSSFSFCVPCRVLLHLQFPHKWMCCIHLHGWKLWPSSSDSSQCYCKQLLCIAAAPGQCRVTRPTQCSQEDFGARSISNFLWSPLQRHAQICMKFGEMYPLAILMISRIIQLASVALNF